VGPGFHRLLKKGISLRSLTVAARLVVFVINVFLSRDREGA
jgi:hypothetical protein